MWARPVRAAAICVSPGQWNGEANCSEGLSVTVMAAMMVPFVMATTPMPSVVMAAAPVPMAMMPMSVPVPDLDHGAVLRGQGRDAHSG